MSRYIDADDAIEKYAHYGIDHMWDATDLEEILNEMPTVDAVSVVRCKECKHWDTADGECYGLDGVHFSKADDYCSKAERKADG